MTDVTKTRIAKPQASMSSSAGAKKPVRLPRLAEMVAAGLRDKILSGELDDGDLLPRQEDLLAEFGVSPPSIREALRILETEGLITVKRGNVGGGLGVVAPGRIGAVTAVDPAVVDLGKWL